METESLIEEYSLIWKGHNEHLQDSFIRLLQRSEFCDVTLYAEGQKIGAHKVFLTTCSGYFKQLFQDLKDERPIVVLKGVQFDVLQQVLRFIYNGQVSIEMDKLSAFLEAARFLRIYGLIDDEIVRKRTLPLVRETDSGSNTEDDQTRLSDNTFGLSKKQSEQTFLGSVLEYGDSLERTKRDVDKKCESRKYHSKETMLETPRHFPRIEESLKEGSSSDIINSPSQPAPENQKYTLESPKRTGEWTSDYESQITMIESPPQETVDNPQPESNRTSSTVKRKRIKSERLSCKEEGPQAMEYFNKRDFANSLAAEIDLTNEDDDSLENERFESSLASSNDNYFQCHICNGTYSNKDSLKKHFAVHILNNTKPA